jgi:DNA-binding NtrC family response regulator
MPSRVILVHDDPDLLNTLSAALTWAGHAVARFTEPKAALSTLETTSFELLITRVEFKRQTIDGVVLAKRAKDKHPGLPVLFVGRSETRLFIEGVGQLLETPASVRDVLEAAKRLLPRGEGARDSG